MCGAHHATMIRRAWVYYEVLPRSRKAISEINLAKMFCAAVLTIAGVKSSKISKYFKKANVSIFPDNLQHLHALRAFRAGHAEPGPNSHRNGRRRATAGYTGIPHAGCPQVSKRGCKVVEANYRTGNKSAKTCSIYHCQTSVCSGCSAKRSICCERSGYRNTSPYGAAVSCTRNPQAQPAGRHAACTAAGFIPQRDAHGERRELHDDQRTECDPGQNRY